MRLRKLYIKAALSGGAARHRAGPSDGAPAFGDRAAFLDRGRPAELARGTSGICPIGTEVEGEEEALRAAAADLAHIQIERMWPEDLWRPVQELGGWARR